MGEWRILMLVGIYTFLLHWKKTYLFKQSSRLFQTSVNGKRATLEDTQMENVQPYILTISLTECTPFIKFPTPTANEDSKTVMNFILSTLVTKFQ